MRRVACVSLFARYCTDKRNVNAEYVSPPAIIGVCAASTMA
jgi:hypothetical protein